MENDPSAVPHRERAREAFFGRLKGPALRPGQAALLQTLLPTLLVDLDTPAPTELTGLFSAPVERVHLEIGFGGGEHLLAETRRRPETGFIGVEPFVNGMAKLLSVVQAEPRPNLRLYDDDATRLLDWLPEASLSGIDLLYPDPWPKKKHFKRRFVNARNLDRFARVLVPGASFCFASDIDTYVDWTLQHCRDHPAFEWTASRAADWHEPFEGWPGTRYEAKAIREGRRPAYLTFRRV
ncbi:tRNA (guanine(46)-N(7))-methyltransferase TrmB [Aurantimonas endophytica]|uniref:tRNA (guanine-N(7)-)-methyltransferase n=1 Tax=Aurantimonas endophytica TaxID=1522175 RepID=A0A7W6HHJ4_9HYPH|nr:tRNA (guanosine(46)-N(7))-methyltransferase TrmB [Aurantimonas endophytica]MBB4005317.1 tRNA (guanine-N7-)-methyltransferase [Aurantimonas endophytica]MCO6406021.1 tRNA (guanosine(46)-N7)-methyltransferase TrmB [Aurantimonas endophytica]